jgi:small subunit ribosomal protein S8
MSLSDPIGDMIARIKNAQQRNHKKVELPSSNFKTKIANILKNEGFIKNFEIIDNNKKPLLSLELKYHSGNPVISNFERVSKPGRRIFSSAESLPKINNGLGIAIVSTPKGVMTDIDARKQKVGGEIICKVF